MLELELLDNLNLEKFLTVGKKYKVYPGEGNDKIVVVLNDNNDKMRVNISRFKQ